MTYEKLSPIDIDRPDLPKEIRMEVETQLNSDGYIAKQNAQITQFKKLEGRKLLPMDYNLISGLKKQAAEKLTAVQPESIGQATRISGVSPADMNVLLIYLEPERRKTKERLHE